jgi:hypothetical protein
LVKFGITQLVIQLAYWSFLPPTMPLVAMVRLTGAPPPEGAVPEAEPDPVALPGALLAADPDAVPEAAPDDAAVEAAPEDDWVAAGAELEAAGVVPELLAPPPDDELHADRASAIAAPAANTAVTRRLLPMYRPPHRAAIDIMMSVCQYSG